MKTGLTNPEGISITTNPYQGLKCDGIDGSDGSPGHFNYYKSLSGIEIQKSQVQFHPQLISITTNPYQGLKWLMVNYILPLGKFQLLQIPIRD